MVTIVNVGNDSVDNNEWKKIQDELEAGKQVKVVDGDQNLLKVLSSADLGKITQDQLNQQVSQSGEGFTPNEAKLKSDMDALVAKIEQLKEQNASELEIKAKQAELTSLIKQANKAFVKSGKSFDLASYYQASGQKNPFTGKAKAQVLINQDGGPQGDKTPYSAKAQGTDGFMPPDGWGAQATGANVKFNSAAYVQSMGMQNNIMDAWDSINKNTNRGKQLMQLFFHFARMAESGDMSSMYQFMKFITYIVSKDKAKQQIEMGKKLIQLQELSRQWTNKLLDVQADSADPNSSSELMKTMTIVKSETDAIATSQKLISQMMEEFSQVVETMTNVTKAALDAAGRIMRKVSQMN